jgi:hypothetical protein
MRVRMLRDPEVVRFLNRETVAVQMDVTHDGVPDLPAFAQHREALRTVIWSHLGFGVWSLIAPDGSVSYVSAPSASSGGMLANSAEQAIPQLHMALELHAALQPLLADAERNAAEIERLRAQSTPLAMNLHALTTFFLMGARDGRWATIRQAVTQPPGTRWIAVPGAREGVIRALGELLLYEGTIAPPTWLHWSFTDGQVRQKAAAELAHIVGVELPSTPVSGAEFMREWWSSHRDRDEYRVRWAPTLPERNSFMVPAESRMSLAEPHA